MMVCFSMYDGEHECMKVCVKYKCQDVISLGRGVCGHQDVFSSDREYCRLKYSRLKSLLSASVIRNLRFEIKSKLLCFPWKQGITKEKRGY